MTRCNACHASTLQRFSSLCLLRFWFERREIFTGNNFELSIRPFPRYGQVVAGFTSLFLQNLDVVTPARREREGGGLLLRQFGPFQRPGIFCTRNLNPVLRIVVTAQEEFPAVA